MAIYHANTKPIARRAGRSAVAAAAYRSGTELVDARTGLVHDYTRKGGVVWTEILTPDGSAVERNQLWNAAELAEKRKDARTAREWIVALPSELSAEQRTALARDFAQALVVRYGVAVDFAIHAPDREGDHRNHHAHLLTTTRQFRRAPDGGLMLGAKAHIELSDKARRERGLEGAAEEVKAVRMLWERTANAALEAAGIDARIDARSLQAQGIDREATQHLGPAASEMERRGKATDRGDGNRQVHVNNMERARLVAEIIDLKAERARIEAERQKAERLQAALQQLEQAVFDIGLSLRRGTVPETVLSDLGEKAIEQAEAAGLPDDFIKITIQRMGQKVQETVEREEAVERARRKAERKAQRREAKRLQAARQQLEQAVFDVGLVFYRRTIEETAYYDLRGKAIEQAEAAGLSDDVIDATIQRMGQKIVEVIEREEAAEQARMEAEREAERQKAERLQAALQQLEQAVFDAGLALRRGTIEETSYYDLGGKAIQQAEAAGLSDDVIEATIPRMGRKVVEVIEREEAAKRARMEAEREAERQKVERLQKAQQQLEQTVFDAGLALRRGNLQESEALDQIAHALQQASAAGLPDDVIDAITQRMNQKVQEIIEREEAVAQAQAQIEAEREIRRQKLVDLAESLRNDADARIDLRQAYPAAGYRLEERDGRRVWVYPHRDLDPECKAVFNARSEWGERKQARQERERMAAEREARRREAERLQAARQQLEQTVFDAGLAVRRGHLQEPEATVQIDDALQQAAAEGLPDAVIQAALERMHQQVQQQIDQEQQAARIQQEQETVRQIRALTDDIRQVGGWQEDRHRPAFVAAGFVPTGEPNSYRHPLDAATNVAEAQATLFKTLDETRKARERAQRRSTTQQRWTARRERIIARYKENIEKLIIEGPQGDFSDIDHEENLCDNALDFYWDADIRQWRHPYQAILQEDLDRLWQALAEGRERYEKEVHECARRLHLQDILEHMLASKTVQNLQPIVEELSSMGCYRDASGQWGHQQAGTEKGADLDRLIQLFSAVEQHYAALRVKQIERLTADIRHSGWQEDRHRPAFLECGFVPTGEPNTYDHPLGAATNVAEAETALFKALEEPQKPQERARCFHLQEVLESLQASQTVKDLRLIVEALESMGCYRDESGHWGHQQADTQRGADLDRLIKQFNTVERYHGSLAVQLISGLIKDISQSGCWIEDRHQTAFIAAGFMPGDKPGEYIHPLDYIPVVKLSVDMLFFIKDRIRRGGGTHRSPDRKSAVTSRK